MRSLAWTPINFNSMQFNPNAGLNTASQAFGNMARTGADIDNNARMDAYRQKTLLLDKAKLEQAKKYQDASLLLEQDKLNWDKSAIDRKIAEENRLLAKDSKKAALAAEIEANSGWSLADGFFENEIVNTPEYQAYAKEVMKSEMQPGEGILSPENIVAGRLKDFNTQFKNANKRLLSDPTNYYNSVKAKLIESKQFSLEEADKIATEATGRLFPVMSETLGAKLMQNYKGSGSNGTSSTSSTRKSSKLLSSLPDSMDEATLRENFLNKIGVTNKAPFTLGGFRPFDLESYDPTGIMKRDTTVYDIDKTVNALTQGNDGVMPIYAYKALEAAVDNDGQFKFRSEDLYNSDGTESEILKALKTQAKNFQDVQERTTATAVSQGLSLENQMINEHNNAILSKMNPNQTSREKRIATYLKAFPQVANKVANQGLLGNTIEVDVPNTVDTSTTTTEQKTDNKLLSSKLPFSQRVTRDRNTFNEVQKLIDISEERGQLTPSLARAQLNRLNSVGDIITDNYRLSKLRNKLKEIAKSE